MLGGGGGGSTGLAHVLPPRAGESVDAATDAKAWTATPAGFALGGLVGQEKIEHEAVELVWVLQVRKMSGIVDDGLLRIWN